MKTKIIITMILVLGGLSWAVLASAETKSSLTEGTTGDVKIGSGEYWGNDPADIGKEGDVADIKEETKTDELTFEESLKIYEEAKDGLKSGDQQKKAEPTHVRENSTYEPYIKK